jgi:hypothetical protein
MLKFEFAGIELLLEVQTPSDFNRLHCLKSPANLLESLARPANLLVSMKSIDLVDQDSTFTVIGQTKLKSISLATSEPETFALAARRVGELFSRKHFPRIIIIYRANKLLLPYRVVSSLLQEMMMRMREAGMSLEFVVDELRFRLNFSDRFSALIKTFAVCAQRRVETN